MNDKSIILSSSTKSKLNQFINKLEKNPDAVLFLEPVDWKALQLYDYPSIIK